MTLAMDPPTLADAERAAHVYRRRWATLSVLCVSLLVIVVDNTIVNVALPTLVRELGTTTSQLQWVVDAYTLAFAGLLLTAGSLGDRFGRRGALILGLAIFGAGSFAGSLSGSVEALITWRIVMGIGAALIMPATLSILTNVFTVPRERALAIGLWSGVAGLAVALGPVAGGFLLEHYSWGSIFFVNVPLVIIGIIATALVVPTSRDPHSPRIDGPGALLSIVGLAAFVWSIIEAPSAGWTSTQSIAGFAIAAVTLAAFVAWELRVAEPMLDVRFFSNARFTAASLAITLAAFALFGFIFMGTQYLQLVLGYSALAAGVHTLPFAAAAMVTAPSSTKLVQILGTKRTVAAGLMGFTIGLLIVSTSTVTSGYPRVLVAMLFMGGGMGLAQAPATESIMGSLPKEKAGVGSAVNDTTRELGGALGVAIIGSIMASLYTSQLDTHTTNLPPQARETANESLGAALAVSTRIGDAGVALAAGAKEAFVHALSRASLVTAVFALVGSLVALKWLPAHAPAGDDDVETDVETHRADVIDSTAVFADEAFLATTSTRAGSPAVVAVGRD
jgi:EmrB/QacA subfamily drug resistance transporter